MKFKLKKKDFKEILSKAYHIFWVYVNLVIFTYRKLWAEKDGKFSSLCWFVKDSLMSKLNLKKFFTIYCESLKLSLQNHFLQIFLRFFILIRKLSKLNRDSDFVHNSIKNHRTVICKTDSESW